MNKNNILPDEINPETNAAPVVTDADDENAVHEYEDVTGLIELRNEPRKKKKKKPNQKPRPGGMPSPEQIGGQPGKNPQGNNQQDRQNQAPNTPERPTDQRDRPAEKKDRPTKTVNEIAQEYGVHPTQVAQWKKVNCLPMQAGYLKESVGLNRRSMRRVTRLYAKIGQLNMELDWLKKKSGLSL